jgi:hypothetical protein
MRLYSLACSLLNNLCVYDTKDIDACGCIGSAFNEILPRSPHWLHGESMVADFQHRLSLSMRHLQVNRRSIKQFDMFIVPNISFPPSVSHFKHGYIFHRSPHDQQL